MRTSLNAVISLFLGIPVVPFASARDLFVSQSGDNSNSGLTAEEAVVSINEAVARLRQYKEAGRIIILPGLYNRTTQTFPIILTEGISVIGADPQDRPVIKGNLCDPGDPIPFCWDSFEAASIFLLDGRDGHFQEPYIITDLVLTRGTGLYVDAGPIGCMPGTNCPRGPTYRLSFGGAILSLGARLVLQNCVLTQNLAWGAGGAIALLRGSEGLIEDCEIYDNGIAGSFAGLGTAVLAFADSSLVIKQCRIYDNGMNAAGAGFGDCATLGAVCIWENSTLEMSHSILARNCHAALFLHESQASLRRCEISEHVNGARYPGAIEARSSYLELDRVAIFHNWGDFCAIYLQMRSSALVANLTVMNNVSWAKAQVWVDGDASFVATNSIFWTGETPSCSADCPQISVWREATADIRWSNVQGGYAGEGNFSADPVFERNGDWEGILWQGGFFSPGDYRLRPESPCIDVGDPNAPPDPDGTRPDIGAYFFPQYTKDVFIRGDANRDLRIDLGDPIAALMYLFAGIEPPSCLDACDVNDDGVLDIGDPVGLLRYLFDGGMAPMPPFPFAGKDRAPDLLRC